MGISSGLVASPCVSPVLVGLLGQVSQFRDPIQGFISLFVFSLGMGSILLLFGFFFGALRGKVKTEFIQDILGLALDGGEFLLHSSSVDGSFQIDLRSTCCFGIFGSN